MAMKLGPQTDDDLDGWATDESQVKPRSVARKADQAEVATERAPETRRGPQSPRHGKAEKKWERRSYNFRPDLAMRLFKLRKDWVYVDTTMQRAYEYDSVMSENMFVTCLLSYALDQLEAEIEDRTEGGLADQLPQYLPVTQRHPE